MSNIIKKETLAQVNFMKFLRTPFSQNTSGRLLLPVTPSNDKKQIKANTVLYMCSDIKLFAKEVV